MSPRLCVCCRCLGALALGPFGLAEPPMRQQPASPRHIGVLVAHGSSPESNEAQAFRQGLRDAGLRRRT